MAKNANLKNSVAQVVKTNGVKGITGANLQTTILQVIDKLGGGYQFGGLVQPNGTFPLDVNGNSLTDQNFAFLASTPGTYTNFGGLVVNEGEVCVFLWDGTWTKQVTEITTKMELNQLGQSLEEIFFNVSDELKKAFLVHNKFVAFTDGVVSGVESIGYDWRMLSIPIEIGIEYKFHYDRVPDGQCSWFVTNNDYSAPSTIVAGRNGDSLVNCTIIDAENKIASFVSPVNGLFNINFDLQPQFPPRLSYVLFQKVSDTIEHNVIGIPQTILNNLHNISGNIVALEAVISRMTTDGEVQDVELKTTSLSTWGLENYPSFVGGITKNSSNPAGKLYKIKTISPIASGNRRIRIYKKERDSNENITGLTPLSTHNITSADNWTELDVSALDIQVPADSVLGIEMLNNEDVMYYSSGVSVEKDQQVLFYNIVASSESTILTNFNTNCGGVTFSVLTKVVDISNSPQYKQLENRVSVLESEVNNIWSNLNVVIMGDSITWLGGDNCDDVDGWTKWFKDKAKPLSCKSYARSGATMTNLETTEYNITENTGSTTKDNVFYNQINRLIHDYDNNLQVAPDVLIVALGTNDFGRPRVPNADSVFTENLSSYTTGESVTTMLSIAQAIRYGVEMLYMKFPNVQLMFLSPQQSTWNTFENRLGVGDQIEQSCRYMGIPCLRLDYEAGTWLIRENVAYYKTYDGTHTSETGARRNGYLIEKWAKTKLQY